MEDYKYYYHRKTDFCDMGYKDLVHHITYLQDTVIPSIESEVTRRDKALEAVKKNLIDEIHELHVQLDDRNDVIETLEKQIEELDKTNNKIHENLQREIDRREEAEKKLAEKEYIDTDIAITNRVSKLFMNTMFGHENEEPYCHCVICSKAMRELDDKIDKVKTKVMEVGTENKNKTVFNDPFITENHTMHAEYRHAHYSDYAEHLKNKLDNLKKAGFSHDDALGLIPMWDDHDFEEWIRK